MASIEDIAFHNAPIRQLRCYAVVPPKLPGVVNGSFSADLIKGATLYVPAGTGMAYAESDWKIYLRILLRWKSKRTHERRCVVMHDAPSLCVKKRWAILTHLL